MIVQTFCSKGHFTSTKKGTCGYILHFLDMIRFLQVKKVIWENRKEMGTKVWEMSVIYSEKSKSPSKQRLSSAFFL